MTTEREHGAVLEGRSASLGMGAWMLVVCTATAVSVIGLTRGVANPEALQTPQVEQVLRTLGLSLRGAVLFALVLPLLITTIAAVVIFVKRTRDRMALIFSAAMVCLQSFTSVGNITLLQQGGLARVATMMVLWLAMPGVLAVLYLFPDGRFYPRWTRFAYPVSIAAFLMLRSLPEQMMSLIRPSADLDPRGQMGLLVVSAAVVSGAYAQFRRYRDVSTSVERQQAKWVTFPLGVAFGYTLLGIVLPSAFVNLTDAWLGWVMLGAMPLGVLVPICITIAILKYRLYDIDVVISKTVVFAGLAAFITAIYVGIVVGVGTLLGAGGEPNLALSIVATAVVAVAFQPVRERLTRLANRLVFGKRATPYEVLSSFSEHLGEVAAPEQTLERMAKLLVDGTGAARAQVWLDVSGELHPAVTWPPHMIDSSEPDHLVQILHEGQALGALSVDKQRGESLTPADQKLVDDLATQAGLVLRNLRLNDELRARIQELDGSRRRLVQAQDVERRRLERDLRDGAQQQLTRLTHAVREAAAQADVESATKAADLLVQVSEDGDAAVRTLRELAYGIYPPVLANEGLAGALAAQASRAAVPIAIEAGGLGRYDPQAEVAVYFCVLEAINNAAKYADPSVVNVHLAQANGHLTFEVRDDGSGFEPSTSKKGHGTTNMADRLDVLGGVLEIDSEPGWGTTVRGRIPVEPIGPEVRT